jgi:hypothetical protein
MQRPERTVQRQPERQPERTRQQAIHALERAQSLVAGLALNDTPQAGAAVRVRLHDDREQDRDRGMGF